MKLRLVAILATSLIAVAFARADDYSFKEPFKRTGAFSATGAITLENVNGDIDIRTWDKNEILIEGEKSAKTEEELKAVDLAMDVSESHAAIKVRLPKRSGGWFSDGTIRASVRFSLTIPAKAILERVDGQRHRFCRWRPRQSSCRDRQREYLHHQSWRQRPVPYGQWPDQG